jgi:hypothetical protein
MDLFLMQFLHVPLASESRDHAKIYPSKSLLRGAGDVAAGFTLRPFVALFTQMFVLLAAGHVTEVASPLIFAIAAIAQLLNVVG